MTGRRTPAPPKPLTAGGGIIVRRHGNGTRVLVIHRKGVWDLPKGKLDPGETVVECARREVREELGIDDLRVVDLLGTTEHRYAEDGTERVKTTWWYLMETDATAFRPQASEQITEVAWMTPEEAAARLGYDTLREFVVRHRDRLEDA